MIELERIMHIEDDLSIQEITRVALEIVGGFPDFILLDVMMPGMDGPETLSRLRQLPGSAALPVVFMTAKVQSHEIDIYRNLGAAEVIIKPFDPMTLADQISAIWAQTHVQDH